MRVAVLADVHANLAALEAVLDEAYRRGVEQIVCLGDLVGYHAEPNECVELLAGHGALCVLGNHDLGALGEVAGTTNQVAAWVQAWTGAQLTAASRQFLAGLPRRRDFPWGVAVHGCYINPAHVTGYISATTAPWNLSWLAEHARPPYLALFGHTHMPVLHSHLLGDRPLSPEGPMRLPNQELVLANPGSVGQPRDGDARASFALLDVDAWTFELVRVEYDIERTVSSLRAARFDESLRVRLSEGR